MKKVIFLILLIVSSIAFSDITGIDTKKIIRDHYNKKDSFMIKNDYFLPKVGRDYNFRAFEWYTSKDTAIKFAENKNYTIEGNDLILTNIKFAGMVLSELRLTYENDRLVSWIAHGRADSEVLNALLSTYNTKYNDLIESHTDNLRMLISRNRTNSFFIILDADMITFYYQSPELFDRILKGDTEEKELQRIRLENEKKQKEKIKQDMLNDL